jgi:hypothetical protein
MPNPAKYVLYFFLSIFIHVNNINRLSYLQYMSGLKQVIRHIDAVICSKCAYFSKHKHSIILSKCTKFGEKNLISGNIHYPYARDSRENDGLCGEQGRYFTHIPFQKVDAIVVTAKGETVRE